MNENTFDVIDLLVGAWPLLGVCRPSLENCCFLPDSMLSDICTITSIFSLASANRQHPVSELRRLAELLGKCQKVFRTQHENSSQLSRWMVSVFFSAPCGSSKRIAVEQTRPPLPDMPSDPTPRSQSSCETMSNSYKTHWSSVTVSQEGLIRSPSHSILLCQQTQVGCSFCSSY